MPSYPTPLPNQAIVFPNDITADPCPCTNGCDEYCVPVFPDDVTTWLMTNPCTDTSEELVQNTDFTVTGLTGWTQDDSNGSENDWTADVCGVETTPTSKIMKPTVAVALEEYKTYTFAIIYTDLPDCCYYFVGFNEDGSYDELGEICDPDQTLTVPIGKGGYTNYGFYLAGDCCQGEDPCPCLQTLVLNRLVYDCEYTLTVYDKEGNSVGTGTITLYDGFSVAQVDWAEITTDPEQCYYIDTGGGVNQRSNAFCVKDPDTTLACFLEITYSNDEDAMGFYFPVGLELSFRVEGTLKRPTYPLETEKYRYSDGEGKLLSGTRLKIQEMNIAAMPEFMHDALSLAVLHDTFKIEAVEYLIESGEYSPAWFPGALMGSVNLQVSKKTQDTRNIYA